MKILKKAKILPVTCETCGCVFLPKAKDLECAEFGWTKNQARCPICKDKNYVRFEKEKDDWYAKNNKENQGVDH